MKPRRWILAMFWTSFLAGMFVLLDSTADLTGSFAGSNFDATNSLVGVLIIVTAFTLLLSGKSIIEK